MRYAFERTCVSLSMCSRGTAEKQYTFILHIKFLRIFVQNKKGKMVFVFPKPFFRSEWEMGEQHEIKSIKRQAADFSDHAFCRKSCEN